jgi:hypothetical protein
VRAVFALIIFFIVFFAIYFVHIKYFNVEVLFYSSIFDGILAAAITAIITHSSDYFGLYNQFEKALMTLVWLLVAYSIAISVPTVIDRSLSFYILEKLNQRGGGIQLARFEEVFTREYIHEHRLLDVRLTEQQKSGTIQIVDGCVLLTDWGRFLSRISRSFRSNLLPEKRLLMGEYSGDLTDPFRYSDNSVDYTCGERSE